MRQSSPVGGLLSSTLPVLSWCTPSLAGKLATRLFLRTREGSAPDNPAAPLGAATIGLSGTGAIRDLYVWGERGPIVLLVHGWGVDSSSMYSLTRPLRARGFRVIAFDAPAHGVNPGSQATMSEFVAGVRRVLEQLSNGERVHAIVGHSLGALAVVAALKDAQHVPKRLVLISAPSCLNQSLLAFSNAWSFPRKVEAAIRQELLVKNGVPIEYWDVRTLAAPNRFPSLVVHDRNDRMVACGEADVVARALGSATRLQLTEGLGHVRILADRSTTALVADFVAAS
jgi:omega-6 fatty acid desaturase (delta-12 desaturase)